LNEIAAKFEKNNAAAEALYYIAAWHEAEGLKYNPSPEQTYRWDYKKAVTLASEIIKKYPDSYGARHAQSLMMRLKERSLGLSVENVYPIDKVMLVNLSYRNLKKGNFRLIKLSDAQIRELSALYQQDKIVSYLNKLKVDKQWSVDLIDEGDFQTHSVDISVPACKNGIWMLMVSEKEDFSYNKNGISYSIFNVSDLSYFYRQIDGKYEFTLTDRNSGVPTRMAIL
jgi:hypothetical protein